MFSTYFPSDIPPYAIPILIFLFLYTFLWLVKKIIISRLKAFSEKTKTKFDDAVIAGFNEISWPFYLFVSLFFALQFAQTLPLFEAIIQNATLVVVVFYSIKLIQKIIHYASERYIENEEKRVQGKKQDPAIIRLVSKAGQYFLWLLGLLLIISNSGYDITALIAGLGVAGIAIGLALQNILTDIFSSLSIYFDKPFKVGDFIILGTDMGVVQKIGIKTTRVQALQGEEIVFSNKELTESRIHNYGKMSRRRVEFRFGIEYDTPLEKIKKVNELIKQSVEKVNGATLDRAHFKAFGDFSLIFEVVYFVPTGDYNAYMDAQQTINHSLVELFGKNKVNFAYPTQKIFLSK